MNSGHASSRIDEAEARCAGDGLTPARHTEFSVDGDRLRLDGVPRDVELLSDLSKREVCGEVREQSQFGRSEGPVDAPAVGRQGELTLQLLHFVDEDADMRAFLQQLAELAEK